MNKFRKTEINKAQSRRNITQITLLDIEDLEFLIKNLPIKNTAGPCDNTDGFHKTFKEEIITIL